MCDDKKHCWLSVVFGTESLRCIQQLPGVDRRQQPDHQERCTGGNGPMLHQTGTEGQGTGVGRNTGNSVIYDIVLHGKTLK